MQNVETPPRRSTTRDVNGSLFGTPLGRPWPDVLLLGICLSAHFALPPNPSIPVSDGDVAKPVTGVAQVTKKAPPFYLSHS